MMPFRTVRKKIGDLLLERRIINPEQLRQALEEQRKKGGYLSQHLINLGFATPLDIAVCLSNQYNFAYLPLKNYIISKDVLDIIPLKWIKIYSLIPVDKIGDVLTVAMADPLNEGVIQMLHQITNCEIEVFVSTYDEINDTISRYYGEKLQDLKEAYLDAKDLGKIMTANDFIQTKVYSGPERREYVRINKELPITYYIHGKAFQSKTKNISYGGVCFLSNVFIPIDTNLACKIYLKDKHNPIDVVMNILRVQAQDRTGEGGAQQLSEQAYETAGIFEFITAEDRESLVAFLKENIP
jgi:type II secretory ATPase GspE/PulE/Tfp pilus assembly ATPase PilB-like protein